MLFKESITVPMDDFPFKSTKSTLWYDNLLERFCKMFQAVGLYCSCHAAQANKGNFHKTYNTTLYVLLQVGGAIAAAL